MTGIYKITNKINGKCYIGQAIDIKRRWNDHRKEAFNPHSHCYEYPLYRAMRKYGIGHFKFEIIEECLQEELNDKEIFYIAKYNAYGDGGYNQNEGGNSNTHNYKLTFDDISQIINRLKTTLDNTKIIASEFGVGFTTIRGINVGAIYRRESEVYPIRPDMSQLCKDDNGGYKFK